MDRIEILGIIACLGLTTGNYLWQAFNDKNWAQASERSYFQFIALVLFVIGLKLAG